MEIDMTKLMENLVEQTEWTSLDLMQYKLFDNKFYFTFMLTTKEGDILKFLGNKNFDICNLDLNRFSGD